MNFPLDRFNPEETSIDEFLVRFESLAEQYQLSRDRYNLKLSTALKGPAYEEYIRLPPELKNCYDTLKQNLTKRFKSTAEHFRQRFRNMRKNRPETHAQFVASMKHCFLRWVELEETEKTFEGLTDLMLMDQLRATLDGESIRFILQQGATSLDEWIKFADRFQTANEAHQDGKTNKQVARQPDKQNRPPPHPPSWPNRQNPRGNLDNRGNGYKPDLFRQENRRECKYCKRTNHSSDQCRQRTKQYKISHIKPTAATPPPKPATSYSANKPGRPAVIEEVTVNERSAVCLYDSGLLFDAVVKQDYVQDHQWTDQRIELQGPDLNRPPATVQITTIQVKTKYVTGLIKAAVMPNLNYDLILGTEYVILGEPEEPMKIEAISCHAQTRQERDEEDASTSGHSLLPKEIREEQRQDESLKKCFAAAKETSDPTKPGAYYLKANLLYRRSPKGLEQIVVPSKRREEVLRTSHDIAFAGHAGQGATAQRIAQYFYWPGVSEDTKRYVMSCHTCQKRTQRSYVVPVTLGNLPIADTPLTRLAADVIGPLPLSKTGNRFILTLVCTSSLWAEAVPLKRITTTHVTEAMLQVFTRIGFPREILTDNAQSFTGKLAQEVYSAFKAQHISIAPYRPATNGSCERFNQTLMGILRKIVNDRTQDWDKFIPAALFAYRQIPTRQTGFSPASMIFGHNIAGPLEAMKESWEEGKTDPNLTTASQYVADLHHRLASTWAVATKTLKAARARQAKYFNRRAKDRELKPGEQVLLLIQKANNKLEIQWEGPYPVVERISRCIYTIRINGKEKRHHINLLKPYVARETRNFLAMAIAVETVSTEHLGYEQPLQPSETHDDVTINPKLTGKQKRQAADLLARFPDTLTDRPGKTDLIEVKFKVLNSTPIRSKPYALPLAMQDVVKEEVKELLDQGIVSHSESPFSSPIILLKKPDGKHRLVVDFRKINEIIEFQPEPIPNQAEIFTRLSDARYLSKVDLVKGFHQVPVATHLRKYLAFTTATDHLQFNYLPFGLHVAPAIFSRMMTRLLQPLNNPAIIHYMDDILIVSKTWEEHIKSLDQLLQRLKETGLTIKPSKCLIGHTSLDFLGHTIEDGSLLPQQKNVDKMMRATKPTTKKHIRAFLGMCGFYQKFIKGYNVIAAPLTELTKKRQPDKIVWNEAAEQAFQMLKEKISSQPVLALPDPSKRFYIQSDASMVGVGAALLQARQKGLQPIRNRVPRYTVWHPEV